MPGKKLLLIMSVALSLGIAAGASVTYGAYVTPMIGGGQVGMGTAPMKHADVMFDGTNITVHVDTTVAIPTLRSLSAPDEFDPAQPWAVLQGKAYNFQYAWNPGGFITLPSGAGIWVERLHHDAGLESYLRPPAAPAYASVFTADGERWKWSGAMQHNVYAVLDPTRSVYEAIYKVYIGDADTGVPVDGYGSATVTWTWNAVPVPEPAAVGMLGLGSVLLRLRRKA